MDSSKVELKGGAGGADYVISAVGDMGKQMPQPGSNVIAAKVGGSPLAPAVYGGKKSKKQQKQQKQQKKQSKKEKKVDGGKKQEKKEKKVDGGKKQEKEEKQEDMPEKQDDMPEIPVDGGSILVDLALPAAFIGATHLYKKGKTSKVVPSQFRGRLYSRRSRR